MNGWGGKDASQIINQGNKVKQGNQRSQGNQASQVNHKNQVNQFNQINIYLTKKAHIYSNNFRR